MLQVYRTGDESAVDVSDEVIAFVNEKNPELTDGLKMSYWRDEARILRSRIDLLVRNARMGLILVVLCLALFLDIRLALWVSIGIAVSFCGAFLGLVLFDVSINMISLFAFILVLGIVVDDAIVVGENVFTFREAGENPEIAAKKGVFQVTTPVIFSVSTTIAAFSPLLYEIVERPIH
jgi:multidrug efflux pump subunit AcrB